MNWLKRWRGEKMGKTKIRFKGYTEDWEQRKLGELASSFEYGLNAAAKEYDGENKYIRITDIDDNTHEFLTDNLTSPDIELTGADNYKLTEGDILFARTGASVGKSYIYKNSDGLVYYAGFLIRARIKEEYDTEFVFQNTLTDRYNKYIAVTSQRSGQPGVNAQEYAEFEIKVPKKEEQTKIGTYFRNIDNLITLHQRKCDEAKKLKKCMLQKMFPKDGEKVPEIRFTGFTGDWKQRKLGDVFKEYSEKNHAEQPALTIMQGEGTIKREDSERNLLYNKSNLSSYKMVYQDDFIVHLRSFEGGLEKASCNGIVSPAYHIFHGEKADSRFYYSYFRSYEFIKRKLVPHIYGIRDGRSIDIAGMKTIDIPYPSFEEQRRIGDYLDSVNNLITFHHRKSNLFNKTCRNAWEQRKLGELASSFEYGLNAAAKEYDGENKYIRITDIDDNTHEFLTDNLTSPDIELTGADNYKLTEGDILFARTGASVGKSYIYKNSDGLVYYAGFLIRARIKEEYDTEFVFQNTLTDRYNKYIAVTSQRSGQPGVNAQEYAEFEIKVPKKEEQTKIGTYFRNIDNLITLHQRKCDEAKKLKKCMLQKMFPKDGEKVPEIRFTGFTGDWKQRKLGEIIEVCSGRDYKHLEKGNVPVYGTGGYMLSVSKALSADKDAVGIGRKGTIDKPYILKAPFWTVDTLFYCVSKEDCDLNFIFDIFQNINWKALDESTGVPSLSKAVINKVKVLIPSVVEQIKIGKYFSLLDNRITFHQQKCDELKNIKKFMLQNMFVSEK